MAVFRACFSGLTHVYGTYDPKTGRVRQVKEPVTDEVILAHIEGRRPYGVYLLVQDHTRAMAVDFDQERLDLPLGFIAAARKHGLAPYIERSKSKGYHVWVFFGSDGVLTATARRVAQQLLAEIGEPNVEVFPKQDSLDTRTVYGNFINAPLFGGLVPLGRTVFVDEEDPTMPCMDQWSLLENVQRVPESLLDAVLKGHEPPEHAEGPLPKGQLPPIPPAVRSYGLPPCARRMLVAGVDAYQRVACFRLAIHLRKAGLPRDLAAVALTVWAAKNHPSDTKHVISQAEIAAQTASAYARNYQGCGCGDPAVRPHCDPNCWLRSGRMPKDTGTLRTGTPGRLRPGNNQRGSS